VKASLAAKPAKHLLKDYQNFLSISYDTKSERPTMTFNGKNPDKLPPVKQDQMIYQNKIVDISNHEQRHLQFHTVFDNEKQVITVTYIKKRQMLQLKFGKNKQIARGKLSKPSLFPMKLQHDLLNWKVSLQYVVDGDKFILLINDKPFLSLPFKANATSAEPMNVEEGTIKLNGVQVHDGWCMWTEDTIVGWYRLAADLQPTTEINLSHLRCSSTNMINTLIDVLGRTIDEEQGLKKLTIDSFSDHNSLQEWPLEQLLHKSPHLEHLEIR